MRVPFVLLFGMACKAPAVPSSEIASLQTSGSNLADGELRIWYGADIVASLLD